MQKGKQNKATNATGNTERNMHGTSLRRIAQWGTSGGTRAGSRPSCRNNKPIAKNSVSCWQKIYVVYNFHGIRTASKLPIIQLFNKGAEEIANDLSISKPATAQILFNNEHLIKYKFAHTTPTTNESCPFAYVKEKSLKNKHFTSTR